MLLCFCTLNATERGVYKFYNCAEYEPYQTHFVLFTFCLPHYFSHYLRRSFYSTENFSFSSYCRSELSIILTVLIKYKNNNQLSQTPRNGSAALNRLTLLNSTHSTSHCHRTVNMGQNVPLQISANYTQTLNYCVTQWDSGKVLSHSWPCSYCFQKIWAF